MSGLTRAWTVIAALAMVFAMPITASAADPSTRAFLRLDVGQHTAQINRIAVDSAETVVVTGSDDKTLRVWSAGNGDLLGVLRVPIEDGWEGKIHAVAVAADGKSAVAAGYTGSAWDRPYRLYRFDLEKMGVTRLISNLPAIVNDLVLSPDGRFLAIGYGNKAGFEVWNAATLQPLTIPGTIPATGIAGMVSSMSFDQTGRLAVVAYDGFLRTYAAETFAALGKAKLPAAHPTSVAFSPDGARIAVGYEDQQAPDVFSAGTLSRLPAPPLKGIKAGTAGTVAWAKRPTGGFDLLAGGTMTVANGRFVVRRWQADGSFADLAVAGNTVTHLVPLSDGGFLYASADPSWGRLDGSGRPTYSRERSIADFRDAHNGRFAISPSGSKIAFSLEREGGKFLHVNMGDRGLTTATALTESAGVTDAISITPRPDADAAAIKLTDWRNSPRPALAGKPLKLEQGEYARSLALLPDRKRFVLGAEFTLNLFDTTGKPLKQVQLPAPAWALAASRDGRYVVAALGDGSLRWYNVGPVREPLAEVVALFVHRDGRRWVAWTPEGFFDYAQDGGSDLVGFHLNDGKAKTLWLEFEQAYRILYSSDLVTAKLDPANDERIARQAEQIGNPRFIVADRPEIAVSELCSGSVGPTPRCQPATTVTRGAARQRIAPGAGAPGPDKDPAADNDAAQVTLRFKVKSRTGVGQIQIFNGDRNVSEPRLVQGTSRIGTEPPADAGAVATELHEATVDLEPGENAVEIRVFDKLGRVYGASEPLRLVRAPPKAEPPRKRRLLVLAVGIDRYRGEVPALSYAGSDARTFAGLIKANIPPPYDSDASLVEVTELYDDAATKPAVIAALGALRDKARPGDLTVVYIAGHGDVRTVAPDSPQQNYYFLTADVDKVGDETVRTRGLSGREVVDALSNLHTKDILLIFDTCHAGQFLKSGIDHLSREIGNPNIWSAATSYQEAADGFQSTGHGLFFHAVSMALTDPQGGVAADGQNRVYLRAIGEFLRMKVPELARTVGHRQKAFIYQPSSTDEDEENIPLARRGP